MARHHVRPDGSVGRCDAKEGGRCKFAREGALHFESASEAQEYAAELLAHRSGGFMQGGAGSGVANSASSGASSTALGADQESALNLSEEKWAARMGELRNDFSARKYVASSPAARGVDLAAVVKGDSGSPSDSGVTLIAERETRMSSAELVAHMDRLKRDPSVWEHVVSSPDAMGGELAAVANGALEAGGRENLLLAVRAVRHENMIPDARRYVVTHPDLWDEALSDPEFYGWSDEDVRDVFEVSRELGLSDVEKRQRVNGRLADRDLPKWGPPHSVSGFERRASDAVSGIYRMRGFVRPETPRQVARTRGLPDSELIREAAERAMGGGAGE